MLNNTSEAFDKINASFLPANYEADKKLQKVIQLVKMKEGAQMSRLRAPWRKKAIPLVSIDKITCIGMK